MGVVRLFRSRGHLRIGDTEIVEMQSARVGTEEEGLRREGVNHGWRINGAIRHQKKREVSQMQRSGSQRLIFGRVPLPVLLKRNHNLVLHLTSLTDCSFHHTVCTSRVEHLAIRTEP